MTVHRIIGVDPGETVGICWITYGELGMARSLNAQQMSWDDALRMLRSSIPNCTLVAVEEWKLYASSAETLVGDSMHTVEIIGHIKEIAWERVPVEQHPPSIKDPAWRFLQKVGLPVPSDSTIHAKDAAAQAAWSLRGLLYNRRGT